MRKRRPSLLPLRRRQRLRRRPSSGLGLSRVRQGKPHPETFGELVEIRPRARRADALLQASEDTQRPTVARRVEETRLQLTDLGEDRITQLAELHLVELSRLAPILDHLVTSAGDPDASRLSRPPASASDPVR